MAIWKTYRVADVVTEISEEKFVLPVIQRSLVWTEEKMELLFDTLLKGDSFGGIMVIEEEKNTKPLFNYRSFTKDGNFVYSRQINELEQQQLFVIDGQQRLQTFYIGLYGSINGKALYFDLYSDFDAEFEFKFEKDEAKLPRFSKENTDRKIPEHCWYPVKSLLDKLKTMGGKHRQVAREIIQNRDIKDDEKKDCIEENILIFNESIRNSEALGVSKVAINKTLPEVDNRQRIVELFRRLNDGGTRLSSFDLVASILKGFSWEMEGFLKEVLETYQDIGLTQDNLIKLIFLLQDNHNKEMASIEATDAEFAIDNQARIKATIKALKDFLVASETYEYYKEGNRSFIPLFFIAYHIFHQNIDSDRLSDYFNTYETGHVDFKRIKRWFYHSLVNGVFKSRGAGWIPYRTGVKKLLNTIRNFKGQRFPTDDLFQVYTEHPLTFTTAYTKDNLDQLDRSFVFYLIYNNANSFRKNDVDHIMPKSILDSKGYSWDKINSIKNFQLLDYGTNRGAKNGKPFSEWVNNPEYVKDKPFYIAQHLIPEDDSIWTEDEFERFIDARAFLILSKLTERLKQD